MNDPHKVKEDQQRWHKKSRLIDSEKKRFKRFRKRTMLNAIFTCSCCQKNLFDCNVCKLDTKLITEIETKRPGLYTKAIAFPIEIEGNGQKSPYICLACKKHLKSGKLPPMAATNGLKVYKHDQELELTKLEGNMIAKRTIFMKIFQLPKSRWTALKDKIINQNIPIKDDDILRLASKFAPFLPNLAPFSGIYFFAQALRIVLRLGMVTTCLPKARDGHHMSA